MNMNDLAYLDMPSSISVNPPVCTRVQILPFGELIWENFERLCYRLAKSNQEIESCRLYGTPGQGQEGIDLYARKRFEEKYIVYQCKREKDFGTAKIRKAVDEFLAGEWSQKSKAFVLCTKESLRSRDRLDEIEKQKSRLAGKGITLDPWDSEELSIELKKTPEIVDDFFGREWVKRFCGEDVAESLKNRLDAHQVIEFRKECLKLYSSIFKTIDPGLPGFAIQTPLPMENRYVIPDICDFSFTYSQISYDSRANSGSKGVVPEESGAEQGAHEAMLNEKRSFTSSKKKVPIEDWLMNAPQAVITGGPGSGKSTLLRFIAIDMLQDTPRFAQLARKWGACLPVWVPFGLWTRMISENSEASNSLSDLLHRWLSSWDEVRIWPLIEQALIDQRLLLLVDGIDEYSNEGAARIALDKLRVFIERNKVPGIITGRAHCFSRLEVFYSQWRVGELCELSPGQQCEMVEKWLGHVLVKENGNLIDGDEPSKRDKTRVEAFLRELADSANVRELAQVPLFLNLFLSLFVKGIRIPHNRSAIYDLLFEDFFTRHPDRRATDAQLPSMKKEITREEMRKALESLAYYMDEHFSEGVMEDSQALSVIESYLKDPVDGLGLDSRTAQRFGKEIFNECESSIGLIVRQSSCEVSFYHRVFQDYLAAQHISRLPLRQQEIFVERQCIDPQRLEMLLIIFYLNPEDTNERFLGRINSKQERSTVLERFAIELLLSEIAFGDFRCNPVSRSKIAEKIFVSIELGEWIPHRKRLLKNALLGLSSAELGDTVRMRLSQWFPDRKGAFYRKYIFDAMKSWPRDDGILECLWKGMCDEDKDVQIAAAGTYAHLMEGDEGAGKRIVSLALNSIEPNRKIAAIEALLKGWPQHEEIQKIINLYGNSACPQLRLYSIRGKIHLGIQEDRDLEEVLRLCASRDALGYKWRDELTSALMLGWSRSPEMKKAIMEAIREYPDAGNGLDHDIAMKVLVAGYPQDDEIAEFIGQRLLCDKHFILFLDHTEFWISVGKNFRDNQKLVDAIDKWMMNQEHDDIPGISKAALIGRTKVGREKLLSLLDSWIAFWAAESLIEGWGMDDQVISGRLTDIALGQERKASWIAYLLPKIIRDKETCRERLLQLLKHPDSQRIEYVLMGLTDLGDVTANDDIVGLALEVLKYPPTGYHEYAIAHLIKSYPSDKRVKELAKRELDRRDGNWNSVARAYAHDGEIRNMLVSMAVPLHTQLRDMIAAKVSEMSSDKNFAIFLLDLYDHETEAHIKTQASISYHALLKSSNAEKDKALERLSETIVCCGPDYQERRDAAFCGLVVLDRLGIMKDAIAKMDTDRHSVISAKNWLSPNLPLLRIILQSWDAIKSAFGQETYQIMSGTANGEPLYLWEILCPLADEYPSPRSEAIDFFRNRLERTAQPNILQFLGRVIPKSSLLLEYCVEALHLGKIEWNLKFNEQKEIRISEQIISSQFGGDNEVFSYILALFKEDDTNESLIRILCEGWPESDKFNELHHRIHKLNKEISYLTYYKLLCRCASSAQVFETLEKELKECFDSFRRHSGDFVDPLIPRIQKDDELSERILKHLRNDLTTTERTTLPRLLYESRGLFPKLREWCIEELERQMKGNSEMGFDALSREIRPVADALLDILYPEIVS